MRDLDNFVSAEVAIPPPLVPVAGDGFFGLILAAFAAEESVSLELRIALLDVVTGNSRQPNIVAGKANCLDILDPSFDLLPQASHLDARFG